MKNYIWILFLPLLHSCFKSDLVFEGQFEIVAEAYLYAGRETAGMTLSSMISFGSDSTGGSPVTEALVTLGKEGESWSMEHSKEEPGYYYLEEGPDLHPGDSMTLTMELDGDILTAATVIPGDPPAVSMSASSISIQKVASAMDFRGVEWPDPVELTWDNPDASYYFLHIQNIESSLVSIRPDPPEGMPDKGPGQFAFEMVTQPTNDAFAMINPMQLEYFGTHRIIFTSVNEEYVYLYNSLNQDSRELNEPYSNVEGGLGIFTAFNSDTLYLEVVPIY